MLDLTGDANAHSIAESYIKRLSDSLMHTTNGHGRVANARCQIRPQVFAPWDQTATTMATAMYLMLMAAGAAGMYDDDDAKGSGQ